MFRFAIIKLECLITGSNDERGVNATSPRSGSGARLFILIMSTQWYVNKFSALKIPREREPNSRFAFLKPLCAYSTPLPKSGVDVKCDDEGVLAPIRIIP